MNKRETIFKLVHELVEEQHESWVPGEDWVQYAGPYFNTDEYISSIETILDGWLVLGNKGINFENKFPKLMNFKPLN